MELVYTPGCGVEIETSIYGKKEKQPDMMLFINGSFGVGKTAVAERLVARLPGSLLYDPELVGASLRRIVQAIDSPEDFQDIPLWRPLTVATARMLRETYERDLIIPMTIWRADYFEEIVGTLRRSEPELYHFCLTARAETIYARLRERGAEPGWWEWERVERCVNAFHSPFFARHLPTDDKTLEEIVQEILAVVAAS